MRKFLPLLLIAGLIVLGCSGKKQEAQTGRQGAQTQAQVPEKPPESSNPVTTTPGGVQVQDITEGTGEAAEPGKSVTVNYTGWLTDGTRFDSSIEHGRPFTFKLGAGQVIKGWDEGVAGMKVGGKRKLTIPPEMAYGDRGAGGRIPPGATLVFEVDLLSVQ